MANIQTRVSSVELLWPGLRKTMLTEARGMPITFECDFDKITIKSDRHSIGIPLDSLRYAFENDRYDTLENAAKNAVMYLRLQGYTGFKKARTFRSKRRSILVRQRLG